MATTEKTTLLRCTDNGGNQYLLYPVTTIEAVDGLTEELEALRTAAPAAGRYYTATIGTNWTEAAGLFVQVITLEGILVTDRPIVDILLSTDAFTAHKELTMYDVIHSIHTLDRAIMVYAHEPTDVELRIQLSC